LPERAKSSTEEKKMAAKKGSAKKGSAKGLKAPKQLKKVSPLMTRGFGKV
jgi:hypothetical protein